METKLKKNFFFDKMSEIINEILSDSELFTEMFEDDVDDTENSVDVFLSRITKQDILLLERIYSGDFLLNNDDIISVANILNYLNSKMLPVILIYLKYQIVYSHLNIDNLNIDLVKELDKINLQDTLEETLISKCGRKASKLIIWLDNMRKKNLIEKCANVGDMDTILYLYNASIDISTAFRNACIHDHQNLVSWFIRESSSQLKLIKEGFIIAASHDSFDVLQYLFSFDIIDQDFIDRNINNILLIQNKTTRTVDFLYKKFKISNEFFMDVIMSFYSDDNLPVIEYIIDEILPSLNRETINSIFAKMCQKCAMNSIEWFYYRYIHDIKLSIDFFRDAATQGSIDFFNFLIERELDPTEIIYDLFWLCTSNNRVTFFDYLLRFCYENNIEYSLNPDGDETIFIEICDNGAEDIFLYMFPNGTNPFDIDVHSSEEQGFINACIRDSPKIVKSLIDNFNVDIHAQNDTAFFEAANFDNKEILLILISSLKEDDYFKINQDDIKELMLSTSNSEIIRLVNEQAERYKRIMANKFDTLLDSI